MAGLQKIGPSLWSYVPPRLLPVNHRLPALERLLASIRDHHFRSICSNLGFADPATIVFHPHAAPANLHKVARPLIYYKYDHYAGYGGIPAERQRFLDRSEEQLFKEADLVFVTSAGLRDLHLRDVTGDIHLLPNGVDYALFSRAKEMAPIVPADIAQIPPPRCGYVGQLNEKVDFALLRAIAVRRPNYSIVLVGPYRAGSLASDANFRRLLREPNVHYLGPKPHATIPNYLAALSVGLMPYVMTEWVKFGYPLKLHEYLAAGLRSVAVALPELAPYQHVVTIAASVEDWLQGLDCGVSKQRDPAFASVLQAEARANSWDVRVDRFLAIVAAHRLSKERVGNASSLAI